MNIAMAYYNGARDQVTRWMTHVAELGGLGNHKLFTMPAFDCEPVPDILPNTRLKDEEQITSDWQSAQPARSAAAPNSMFRQFVWHFYLQKLGPWLFIEPDCVPLKKGWLDALEAEYVRGGKPFMGAHVQIERVPEHMSGNGIYPQDTPALAPTIVMHTNWITEGREYELAFDIAGAREVLSQAHFTNLIQHVFRHKGFKSRAEFDALIDPNAVVFHSNKDGSIYQYLSGVARESSSLGSDNSGLGLDPEKARLASPSTEVKANDSPLSPAQTFPEGCDGKETSFPREVKILSEALAMLADSQYHRRKVRDALKKVGLI